MHVSTNWVVIFGRALARASRVAEAQAELHAFGQVPGDILDLATAPFSFELAIREALRDHPMRVDRSAQIRAK
jgi:hypothetical protein